MIRNCIALAIAALLAGSPAGAGEAQDRIFRVGLLGVPERTVDDCEPLHGDGLAMPVRWRTGADVGVGEGQSVTLQVRLRSASLFGVAWV